MQKGQVALFIVIGLFLLVIVGLFVTRTPLSERLPATVSPVKQFIGSCFTQSATRAVNWFYAADPDKLFVPLLHEDAVVWWPVWYDRGTIRLPDDVMSWIDTFASAAQARCTDHFTSFPSAVKEKGLSVDAEFVPRGVQLVLHQPVVVDDTELSDPYRVQVNLRLDVMLDVARGIMRQLQQNPDAIPIDYMVEQARAHRLNVTYAYLDQGGLSSQNVIIYQIDDLEADVSMPFIKFIARME